MATTKLLLKRTLKSTGSLLHWAEASKMRPLSSIILGYSDPLDEGERLLL